MNNKTVEDEEEEDEDGDDNDEEDDNDCDRMETCKYRNGLPTPPIFSRVRRNLYIIKTSSGHLEP